MTVADTTNGEICGCEWESLPDPIPLGNTVPGSRRRRVKTCEQHQREWSIKSDAIGAVDMFVDGCRYEGAERRLWLETAAEQLDAAVYEVEEGEDQ